MPIYFHIQEMWEKIPSPPSFLYLLISVKVFMSSILMPLAGLDNGVIPSSSHGHTNLLRAQILVKHSSS
jgi:hypothetical protein